MENNCLDCALFDICDPDVYEYFADDCFVDMDFVGLDSRVYGDEVWWDEMSYNKYSNSFDCELSEWDLYLIYG